MSESTQDVAAIITSILKQRAAQRQVPLSRRMISIEPKLKDHYVVNRHDIRIQPAFILAARDPIAHVDRVLEAVQVFDRKEYEAKAEKINEVKSRVMQWTSFLERALPKEQYEQFIEQLLPPYVTNGTGPEEHEGEHFQDLDIHFDP